MSNETMTLKPGKIYEASHEDFIGSESFMKTVRKIEKTNIHELGAVKITIPPDLLQSSITVANKAIKNTKIPVQQRQQLTKLAPHVYTMDRTPTKSNPIEKKIKLTWDTWHKKFPQYYENPKEFWAELPDSVAKNTVIPYAPGIVGSLQTHG